MPSMAPMGISAEDKSPQMPDKTYKDEKKLDELFARMRTTIRRQGAPRKASVRPSILGCSLASG